MAMFKAFKPAAMNKIAQAMGYSGDMGEFQDYIEQDPARKARMNMFQDAAVQMAKGGYTKKYNKGGAVPPRRVEIKGQDHMLAYITPEEGELLKAHGGSGKPGPMGIPSFEGDGDGADDGRNYYHVYDYKDKDASPKRVYLGSQQDTVENRMAGSPDLSGFDRSRVPQAFNRDVYQMQYERDLAALQGRPDPYAPAPAPAEEVPVEQAAAQQTANQQVTQQSAQQATQQQQNAAFENALKLQNAGITSPIYQAPFLSGTKFTPSGQYIPDPQDPTKMVPQAYNPLNQGYAAAVANFQQMINSMYNPYQFQITQGVVNKAEGGYIEPQKFAVGGTVTNPAGTQAATPVVTGPSMNTVANPYVQTDPTPTAVRTTAAPQAGNIFAYQPDGTRVEVPSNYNFSATTQTPKNIGDFTVEQMYTPGVPVGGTTIAAQTPVDPRQELAAGTGTLTGSVAVPTATAAASQAQQITPSQANTMQAAQAAPAVDAAMQATAAAQANPQDPRAQITAAQQTVSSVGNLAAAQGNAILINSPVQRNLQAGELISGTGVDATRAAALAAQTDAAAAQANPSAQAMVQDQLSGLMNQFVGGATPAWAAGAIRTANATMAARGLSASSIAGQAVVQAAMESAMPIAMADAQTVAKFESQNLSNRQQSAMMAAEQRAKFMGQEFDQTFQQKVMNASKISDIANQNFTAEQQVQLENSRAANTMNLNNLSNNQALVMAEASALAQLDSQNLNNRQATAVQNAQNFLQVDMANLSNLQQTDLFKAQQRVQSMFTDQAATNAAAQFNASSQNQVDQFFQQLGSQVSQFNATQANAQAQYNAGQTNTVNRFNAELNNQRDQYNAQNQMVIAQANAQWRRQIATADTAAVNRANELNANAILDISKQAYSNLWNFYGDTMEWAWTSAEKELDRYSAMAIAELDASTSAAASSAASKSAAGNAIGSLIGTIGAAIITCWVAREVYGKSNPEWFIFRTWLEYDAPKWFKKLYVTHGENYAKLIAKVPPLKWATKQLMDMVVNKKRRKHNVQTV